MDLYESLIGKAPSKKEEQLAIAAALRKRRAFGEIAQLSGDPVLQTFGKGQADFADKSANELQSTRQHDVDDERTAGYNQGQLAQMAANADETSRYHDMSDATTRRGQDLALQGRLAAALSKKTGKPPRLRVSDIKNLQDLGQDIGSMQGLEKFIADGGKFGAVEVGGVPIPGGRSLSNAMAARGLGTDSAKKAFLAKQEFDRLYTLGARNRLFGATLTPNEQSAWENANPSIRQSDDQIAVAIPILRKVLQQRLKNMGTGLAKEGYNAEAIGEYSSIPGLELPVAGEEAAGGSADSLPAAAPAPATEQPQQLTPEQAARLTALRAKHRGAK